MTTKRCTKCKEIFPLNMNYFHKRGKTFKSACKKCRNKEKREYCINNIEKIKQYALDTKEKRRIYKREWERRTRKINVKYKIISNIRVRIGHLIRGTTKSSNTLKLLGCSLDILKSYLENKFKPGMTWQNYGEWHIDHIRPCASFDLNKKSEQRKCFHYTNLQPLWAKENLMKGAKYDNN